MRQRFRVGDRVIVVDDQIAGIPLGTLGRVVQAFARLPEICDVQFDGYPALRAVVTGALALTPSPTAEHKSQLRTSEE